MYADSTKSQYSRRFSKHCTCPRHPLDTRAACASGVSLSLSLFLSRLSQHACVLAVCNNQTAMTAGNLMYQRPEEQVELNPGRPWSPPIKPTTTVDVESLRRRSSARKRPRTSSLTPLSSTTLPPHPPYKNNYTNEQAAASTDELGRTRPRKTTPSRPNQEAGGSFRTAPLPYLGGDKGNGLGGSSFSGTADDSSAHLSKSAKLLEEDRRKVASIRSFLMNFLEDRDCSIKKRLVRASTRAQVCALFRRRLLPPFRISMLFV